MGAGRLGAGSAADGDAGFGAPEADLGVIDAVDGLVAPLGGGGGVCSGVRVTGRAVLGQQAPAAAAVHVDLTLVQVAAIAAPAPADLHGAADDGGSDLRTQGGKVRPRLLRADDAEVRADGLREGTVLLHHLHDVKDAVQRAGVHRDHGGQAAHRCWEGRRGEDRQRHEGEAVPGLGLLGGIRAGECPGLGGRLPGAEHVDEPAGIRQGGGALRGADAERGGMPGEFIGEVCQPDDLIGDTTRVVGLAFHGFEFRLAVLGGRRGVGNKTGITGLQVVARLTPAEIGIIPSERVAGERIDGVPEERFHGGKGRKECRSTAVRRRGAAFRQRSAAHRRREAAFRRRGAAFRRRGAVFRQRGAAFQHQHEARRHHETAFRRRKRSQQRRNEARRR